MKSRTPALGCEKSFVFVFADVGVAIDGAVLELHFEGRRLRVVTDRLQVAALKGRSIHTRPRGKSADSNSRVMYLMASVRSFSNSSLASHSDTCITATAALNMVSRYSSAVHIGQQSEPCPFISCTRRRFHPDTTSMT